MKKLLLTFSLVAILFGAKAQKVVITGVMFDPQGGDAPSTATDIPNVLPVVKHKGGYEYIQLMATETIDFSQKPHCVVRCTNSGTPNGAPNNGWAETGTERTFKFNLTSGVVNKGEFFYVGGPEKTAGGFLVDENTNTYHPVLDMSGSKWLRTIAYSTGVTNAIVGDDGIGVNNTGLFPNIVKGSSNRPFGIAVFEGTLNIDNTPNTAITVNSVPVDVIFVGFSNDNVLYGPSANRNLDKEVLYSDTNSPNNCYRIPNTDQYVAGYIGDSNPKNQYVYSGQPADNVGNFLKLGGVFNTDDKTWPTPRTGNYVRLVPGSGTVAVRTGFATLAMLEGNAAGSGGTAIEPTKLISPLPVQLISFTAKANKAGKVDLAWATASEQNNSHFEVNRSTDGSNFNKIGEVKGNGTTATLNNYNHTDAKPVLGTNYYQLKQVDFDGKSALSKVLPVKVSLSQNDLKASAAANRASVSINYNAAASGKATFTVYSVSGAKLATVQQSVNAGSNQLNIPVQLGNSLHLLKVEQGGESVSVKF